MLIGQRRVRQVDEHALAVPRRSDPDERPDGFDVAAGLADEAADVVVGELHLDGDGAAAPLEGLDRDFLGLLRERLGHVLDQRPIVDSWSARRRPVAAKTAAAIETSAPKVTPWGSALLCV